MNVDKVLTELRTVFNASCTLRLDDQANDFLDTKVLDGIIGKMLRDGTIEWEPSEEGEVRGYSRRRCAELGRSAREEAEAGASGTAADATVTRDHLLAAIKTRLPEWESEKKEKCPYPRVSLNELRAMVSREKDADSRKTLRRWIERTERGDGVETSAMRGWGCDRLFEILGEYGVAPGPTIPSPDAGDRG